MKNEFPLIDEIRDRDSSEMKSDFDTRLPSKEMEEDAAIFRERWLRAAAELENLRKRTDRRIQMECRRDREALLRGFLKVLDSIEQALASKIEEEPNPWAEGMEAVAAQMQELLAQNGVEMIEAEGVTFDPDLHEAVATVVTTERTEGTVAEVVEKGYRTRQGNLLRPARVIVAMPVKR
jgi:molecular chaperone GrpE